MRIPGVSGDSHLLLVTQYEIYYRLRIPPRQREVTFALSY